MELGGSHRVAAGRHRLGGGDHGDLYDGLIHVIAVDAQQRAKLALGHRGDGDGECERILSGAGRQSRVHVVRRGDFHLEVW